MTVELKPYGKITASPRTLDALAGLFLELNYHRIVSTKKVYRDLACQAQEDFDIIFNALDSKHYYDDVKGVKK